MKSKKKIKIFTLISLHAAVTSPYIGPYASVILSVQAIVTSHQRRYPITDPRMAKLHQVLL
jgi:hypothetical protein